MDMLAIILRENFEVYTHRRKLWWILLLCFICFFFNFLLIGRTTLNTVRIDNQTLYYCSLKQHLIWYDYIHIYVIMMIIDAKLNWWWWLPLRFKSIAFIWCCICWKIPGCEEFAKNFLSKITKNENILSFKEIKTHIQEK